MDSKFLNKYLNDFIQLASPTIEIIDDLIKIKESLKIASYKGNKTIVIGNGGSAAMASHVAVDLTKNAKIRCINFNESDLITCFANDYGYEKWVEQAINFYGDIDDVLIAISSSGTSKNIINGCLAARNKSFSKIITLSGLNPDNELRKLGDINLWVNSMAYNHVENLHQLWLLTVVDLIIGKAEYSASPTNE